MRTGTNGATSFLNISKNEKFRKSPDMQRSRTRIRPLLVAWYSHYLVMKVKNTKLSMARETLLKSRLQLQVVSLAHSFDVGNGSNDR